ncbi:MAG: hypothetical protein U0930_01665 [Pirellulales bacterium]
MDRPMLTRNKRVALALLLVVLVSFLSIVVRSHHNATKRKLALEARHARNERCLAQRDAIDLIVQDQMKKQGIATSKQDYAAKNWSALFDSLIGSRMDQYPQLAELGDEVADEFISKNMVQKENVTRWINEQKSGSSFLAFATDVWDFRTEGGTMFTDTLIIAIDNGQIIGYRMFAECPY